MARSFTRNSSSRCATTTVWTAALLLGLLVFPGGPQGTPAADVELGPGPLPPPPRAGGPTLVETLWKRRSTRQFAERPITRDQLAYLLWAGSGVNRPEEKRRTAPSAWEAYAISIYISSPAGTAVYDPEAHALRPAGAAAGKDLRREIPRAESTQAAPVILVLVMDTRRYPSRASERSRPYLAHADCGVIAQNIHLAAAALGLGTVVTADARPESKELLGLGSDQMALYVLPVGYPREPPEKAGAGAKPAPEKDS